MLESQGDDEAALALYEEAGRQEGALWQANLLAIEARRRIEPAWDPTESIQAVMRSDILTPAAFAECAMVLGDHALRRDKLPEARRWLEYAIASGLEGPDVLLRVALAQRGAGGDPERARNALDQVVALDPALLGDLVCEWEQLQLPSLSASRPIDLEVMRTGRQLDLAFDGPRCWISEKGGDEIVSATLQRDGVSAVPEFHAVEWRQY